MSLLAAMFALPPGDLNTCAAPLAQLEGEEAVAPTTLRDVSGAGPDTAWMVGDGGVIYYTRDGGATWIPQDSGTREDLLSVCAVDASSAWAAGRRGTVLRTRDGGLNWEPMDAGLIRDIYDISASASVASGAGDLDSEGPDASTTVLEPAGASTAWAVADGPVVLRTTDGGATWEHQDPGNLSILFSINVTGPESAMAAGENGTVLATADGGASWESRTTNTGDHLVDLCVTGGEEVAAAWALGETGTVVRSLDGGMTWEAENIDTPSTLTAICAAGASTAWFAGLGGLMRKTADGGATWDILDTGTPNTVRSICAADAENAWAVGENGTALRTYDGGATWIQQYIGDGRTFNHVCASGSDPDTVWAAGDGGSAYRSEDGGFTWTPAYPGTASDLFGVASPDPASAWLVGRDGLVLRTRDAGKSWEEQPSRASYDLHDVSCFDGKIAWAVGRRGTIVRTFDEGYTWYRQDYRDEESGAGEDLFGVYAAGADTAWAVGRGGLIVKTVDAGETWTVQESGTTSDLLSVSGAGGEHAWACGKDGTVLHTGDGGRTWVKVNAGTEATLNAVSVAPSPGAGGGPEGAANPDPGSAPQAAWIAGEGGFVAQTLDGGRTWTDMDTTTENALNGVAAPGPETAYAVGRKGTILHYRSSPRLDAVSPSTAQAKGVVTLSGLAFGEGGQGSYVSFGQARAAEYEQWSDRLIKVVLPPGASLREEVTVTTPRGSSAPRLVVILPRLEGASPGYARTGKPLTISGASFGPSRGDSYVTMGSVKITEFEYWTNNLIRLTVPGNAPESAEVKVVTASGASNPVTVRVSRTPPPLPDLIKPRADFLDPTSAVTGQEVAIYGSGFGPSRGSSLVSLGSTVASEYTGWANDRIVLKVPPGVGGEVKVRVTTAAGTSNALAFTALLPPAIEGASPASVPPGGQVEITGAGFGAREGPTNYVSFNGVRPEAYDYWSGGRIVVKVPADMLGAVAVAVTTPLGTSNQVTLYVKKPDLRDADAAGGTVWAVGEKGTVLRSLDGGSAWAAQDSGTDLWLYGVAAGSASTAWAVGEGGVILVTKDGGAAWAMHPTGATRTLHDVDAVDASTAWAVGDGGVVLKTADGGASWTAQASGTGVALRGVSAVDASTAWAVGDGGVILKTADGGASWTAQNSRVPTSLNGAWALDGSVCWVVGAGGTILRTDNGGLTWTPQGAVNLDSAAVAEAGEMDAGEADAPGGAEDAAGACCCGGVEDAGREGATGAVAGASAAVPGLATATLRAVCAVSPLVAWVVGDGGMVLKTTDGGLTWGSCGPVSSSLYGATAIGASALAVGNHSVTRALP